MSDEFFIHRSRTYATQHRLTLAERLGFGIHGTVHAAMSNVKPGKTAVKGFREIDPYLRERHAYERLREASIAKISGFNVPQLIRFDDNLWVVEITIVTRPFVLDFAGSYLDMPPEFSDEIWEEWESEKMEQFENRWPIVQSLLGELENLGIHLLDVSPSNVAFEFPVEDFSGARQTSPEQLPMSFFRQLFPTRLIGRMSAKVHGTITWSLREWQMRNSRKSFKQGKSEKI